MHFTISGGAVGPLITAIDANVTAAMWGQTSVDSAIDSYTLTPLDGSSASVVHPTGSPAKFKGPQTTQPVVPQVAVINKLTTSLRGRSYNGRTFLPWPTENVVNNGNFDATTRGTMDTAWGNFITAMSGAAHDVLIASYKHSTAALVIGHQVEALLATQRRRQPRPL
jgi:hypothetical protein